MTQLEYFLIIYFPASFTSVCSPYLTFYLVLHIDVIKELFHMRIPEFSPVGRANLKYFAISACALTAATVWIMIVLQSLNMLNMEMSIWQRLGWPFFFVYRMIQKARHPKKFRVDTPEGGIFPEPFCHPFRIETLSSKPLLFILCSDGWTGQTYNSLVITWN